MRLLISQGSHPSFWHSSGTLQDNGDITLHILCGQSFHKRGRNQLLDSINILRLDLLPTKISNWIITLLVRHPSSSSFAWEDEAEDILMITPLKSRSKNFPLAFYKPMVVLLARISFCRNPRWGFGYHFPSHWSMLLKSDQLITS